MLLKRMFKKTWKCIDMGDILSITSRGKAGAHHRELKREQKEMLGLENLVCNSLLP